MPRYLSRASAATAPAPATRSAGSPWKFPPTSRQKELLKEFDSLASETSTPLIKGFFDAVKEIFGEKGKK